MSSGPWCISQSMLTFVWGDEATSSKNIHGLEKELPPPRAFRLATACSYRHLHQIPTARSHTPRLLRAARVHAPDSPEDRYRPDCTGSRGRSPAPDDQLPAASLHRRDHAAPERRILPGCAGKTVPGGSQGSLVQGLLVTVLFRRLLRRCPA